MYLCIIVFVSGLYSGVNLISRNYKNYSQTSVSNSIIHIGLEYNSYHKKIQ